MEQKPKYVCPVAITSLTAVLFLPDPGLTVISLSSILFEGTACRKVHEAEGI